MISGYVHSPPDERQCITVVFEGVLAVSVGLPAMTPRALPAGISMFGEASRRVSQLLGSAAWYARMRLSGMSF